MVSGLEFVQVAAAAIELIKFAKKTIKFIQNAEHVDSHVHELLQKIKGLGRNVKTVGKLVEHRQELKRSGGVSREEQAIWRNLESSMEASKGLLREFKGALAAVNRPNPGKIQKTVMEFRLEWNREELESFEHRLNAQIQAIQLWILSLQVFSADENHQQVMKRLESIHELVLRGKAQLDPGQYASKAFTRWDRDGNTAAMHQLPDNDSDITTLIAEYVTVGESVLSTLDHGKSLKGLPLNDDESEQFWSESSVGNQDNPPNKGLELNGVQADDLLGTKDELEKPGSPPIRTGQSKGTERMRGPSPEPELDDFFGKRPHSHLNNLIRAKGEAVCMHEVKREYEPALRAQNERIEYLEERERKNGIEFSDRDEMLETKANLLINLGRFPEAIQTLLSLSDPKAKMPGEYPRNNRDMALKMARYYWLLGIAYLEQYTSVADSTSLDQAETYAGYAFNARLKLIEDRLTSTDLVESADLCAKIYEAKGDETIADEYRVYIRVPPVQRTQPRVSSLSSGNSLPLIEDGKMVVADEISSGFRAPSAGVLRAGSYSSNNGSGISSADGRSRRQNSEPEFIIDVAKVNSFGSDGKTPLIRYISENRLDLAVKCLMGGADVHLKCTSGIPPIIHATNSDSDEFIKTLLRRGARIDDTDRKGSTALHAAILHKSKHKACFLLQNGAEKDLKNNRGLTTLMVAVKTKNTDLVKVLLDNKVDVQVKTSEGWSAMHYAITANVREIIQLLQRYGADIDVRCNGGKTPLHYACENGKMHSAEELVNLRASLSIYDEGGRSPLCLAVEHGQDEIVSLLLRCGAEPTQSIDKNKWKRYKNEYARIQKMLGPAGPPKRNDSRSTTHTGWSTGSGFSGLSARFKIRSDRN